MAAFQDLVWFVSQQLDNEQRDDMEQFIRLHHDAFALSQVVVVNNSDMRMTHSAVRRNQMTVIFTTGLHDPIMEVTNKVLRGKHFYLAVFMMMGKVANMEDIYEICQFFYDNQFENSLLYFESIDGINQMYGANQYPSYEIENRTDLQKFLRTKMSQVMSAVHDVGGYRFATPMREDAPNLFRVGDRYEGSFYRILSTFVEHLNGSFKELEMPPDALGGRAVNMKQTLQLVRDRQVQFVAHAYALFMPDDDLEKSYPLLVVPWCLMVPLYNSVSTYFYALQPFDTTVWFFVLAAFVLLSCLELLWLRLGHRRGRGSAGVTTALLNSFCYIINISTGRQLLQPSLLRFLLLLAVFFHGFFLSANYTSTLGSILTVNLFHAQLNTMDDLLRAQLPVMIIDYEMEFLLQLHKELPAGFIKLLRPVDSGVFAQHRMQFNSSFAYFVTEDNWQFLDAQQRHLKQRQFKFSDICFGSFHLAFPIQSDCSLWRDLEYYTFRVHSAGLLNYYGRLSFASALRAGIVQRLQEHNEYASAGLQHLAIAFIMLMTMSALAFIVFIIELLTRFKF
ncbi:PREDICTED: uncharacterized protein LOC108615018 [Drosophila arizonae]|uniref:Uncharacterized protein LOC108615018 n=1 Tax=Drosophila arizonae TaxID=7263 RepID=A0ABM1PC02_DROAR|nr:PREDICTED: uncharacterized protein LOC108615018 [Drosophila arizonae]